MAKILSDEYNISISGKLLPFVRGEPLVLEIETEPGENWIPVYDDEDKLRESMKLLGHEVYSIKKIVDGVEFMGSATQAGLRVMLNPYFTEQKTTRWIEIKLSQ